MSEKAGPEPELDARLAELMGLEVCRNVECEGCEAAMYLTDLSGWSPNPIWQYGDGQPYSSDASAAISAAEEALGAGRIEQYQIQARLDEDRVIRIAEVYRAGMVYAGEGELAHALTLALVAALSAEPVESMKGGVQ